MPRVNFVSFTFLFAFGLGSFVGIALALLAVALATPEPEPTIVDAPGAAAMADAATLTPTATTAPSTVTPTPVPVMRTRATLSVHIGPDEDYAVLGTLARGSEISVNGRDSEGDWLAIDFPPGSSARGWIPVDQVVGLSLVQIDDLDVLQATSIETSPIETSPRPRSTPSSSGDNGSSDGGNNGGGNNGGGDAGGPPARTPTPRAASPTPTPTPATIGPSDLAIAGVTTSSGGFIRIGIENLGPGAVPEVTVEVSAAGYSDEILTAPVILRAGDTVMLQTNSLQLNGPTLVSVTLDPAGLLADLDRSNNRLRVEIGPN
jgi:hypothetical protein